MNRFLILCIGILALISFIGISLMYDNKPITGIDESLIRYIQGMEFGFLTDVMKAFSYIGSGKIVILIALVFVIYFIVSKRYREVIIVVVAVSGSALLNHLLKSLFERVRPTIHPMIEQAGYSFPSGHSMNAFTLYVILIIVLWGYVNGKLSRRLLISFSVFMIIMMGLSRIYLGVHYPSDVIGGYLASCAWICVVIFVARPKQSLH